MASDGAVQVDPGTMVISVESIRPLLKTGPCLAFLKMRFSSEAGSIAIDNFRLIESKNGHRFLGSPGHKKGDKFYDDVELVGDLRKIAESVANTAYEKSKGK